MAQQAQVERPSHLIGRYGPRATGVEFGQLLRGDPTILVFDHFLVAFDERGRHQRGGPLLTATGRDLGDLPAEGGTVDGVGEMIPRVADGSGGVSAHTAVLVGKFANLATARSGRLAARSRLFGCPG
jgi:hypothetical protein